MDKDIKLTARFATCQIPTDALDYALEIKADVGGKRYRSLEFFDESEVADTHDFTDMIERSFDKSKELMIELFAKNAMRVDNEH